MKQSLTIKKKKNQKKKNITIIFHIWTLAFLESFYRWHRLASWHFGWFWWRYGHLVEEISPYLCYLCEQNRLQQQITTTI